jgi:hypothetical protein
MEPQAPTVSPTATVSSDRGLFGSKIPPAATFIVAILLFLLPFAEIKCGNAAIANQTGIGFAMGQDWKAVGLFDQKDLEKKSTKEKTLGNSQVIAIAVLVFVVLGLLLTLATSNGMVAAGFAILSVGGLIYFMIDLKSSFNASIKKDVVDKTIDNSNDLGLNGITNSFNDMKPSLGFTPVFWILIIVLLAASFFSWQRGKMRTL